MQVVRAVLLWTFPENVVTLSWDEVLSLALESRAWSHSNCVVSAIVTSDVQVWRWNVLNHTALCLWSTKLSWTWEIWIKSEALIAFVVSSFCLDIFLETDTVVLFPDIGEYINCRNLHDLITERIDDLISDLFPQIWIALINVTKPLISSKVVASSLLVLIVINFDVIGIKTLES